MLAGEKSENHCKTSKPNTGRKKKENESMGEWEEFRNVLMEIRGGAHMLPSTYEAKERKKENTSRTTLEPHSLSLGPKRKAESTTQTRQSRQTARSDTKSNEDPNTRNSKTGHPNGRKRGAEEARAIASRQIICDPQKRQSKIEEYRYSQDGELLRATLFYIQETPRKNNNARTQMQ